MSWLITKRGTVRIQMTGEEIMKSFDVTWETERSNRCSQLKMSDCTSGRLAYVVLQFYSS